MTFQHQFPFVVVADAGKGKHITEGAVSPEAALARLQQLVDEKWPTVLVYDKSGRVLDAGALQRLAEKPPLQVIKADPPPTTEVRRKRALAI